MWQVCRRCGHYLPSEFFSPNPGSAFGCRHIGKKCTARRVRERYHADPEYRAACIRRSTESRDRHAESRREQRREHLSRPEVREHIREYDREWRRARKIK